MLGWTGRPSKRALGCAFVEDVEEEEEGKKGSYYNANSKQGQEEDLDERLQA